MKPSLCLNMIVKNEAARIERCLASVVPYVKAIAVYDTGSTDDTIERINAFANTHQIPTIVEVGDFGDFSSARNAAFALAKRENGTILPFCQFALLVDADMELVVEDPAAFDNLDANAPSYDMMQKGGAVSYGNRRLVNLNVGKPPYVGVTHEYIDFPAFGLIAGAMFVDHADGSNRADKFPRDAMLLECALHEDPKNGRYWYYLGNTYRDWGKPRMAMKAYQTRIDMGGWDEETFDAMMSVASCMRSLGDMNAFVAKMLEAHSFRPSRAEPLYELAKHYRERPNQQPAALVFAKAGVNLKRPNDLLFVNDYVYDHGLRYEYSIVGSYNERERGRAFEVTDDLALDPNSPADIRWGSRSNLYWHVKPLSTYCGTFKDHILDFTPPDGYTAMNPSIEECNGKLKCNIRCVNYRMDSEGRYLINGTGGEANGTNPIDTRNFLARLDVDLKVKDAAEIVWRREPPNFNLVTGLEDVRLYRSRGDLWFNACVRERSMFGTCQQARGQLVYDDPKLAHVAHFEVMSGDERHEKNWMAMPHHGAQDFIYRLDTILHADSPSTDPSTTKFPLKINVADISGSSQLIEFKSGWLAVVHEAAAGPDGKRVYWHRFAWFEKDGKLRRLSLPFVFLDRQIEFCAGIAYHPNRRDLIISFGVRDAEAHLATVAIEEVAMMCWKFHEN